MNTTLPPPSTHPKSPKHPKGSVALEQRILPLKNASSALKQNSVLILLRAPREGRVWWRRGRRAECMNMTPSMRWTLF